MTITEYVTLVTSTNKDPFCKEELIIDEDFDVMMLSRLCSNNIPKKRLMLAWDMIVSAVAEKFVGAQTVEFFPESVLEFLIENNIALSGLSHIRLPKKYLQRIYDKNNNYWEALKNML